MEIIDAQNVMAVGEQPLAKMRTEEAGTAGHQHALAQGDPSWQPRAMATSTHRLCRVALRQHGDKNQLVKITSIATTESKN
jgi:hypothetical protein